MPDEDINPRTAAAKKFDLSKKVGPFPLYVWVAGGVALLAGAYFLWKKHTASSTAATPLPPQRQPRRVRQPPVREQQARGISNTGRLLLSLPHLHRLRYQSTGKVERTHRLWEVLQRYRPRLTQV